MKPEHCKIIVIYIHIWAETSRLKWSTGNLWWRQFIDLNTVCGRSKSLVLVTMHDHPYRLRLKTFMHIWLSPPPLTQNQSIRTWARLRDTYVNYHCVAGRDSILVLSSFTGSAGSGFLKREEVVYIHIIEWRMNFIHSDYLFIARCSHSKNATSFENMRDFSKIICSNRGNVYSWTFLSLTNNVVCFERYIVPKTSLLLGVNSLRNIVCPCDCYF